MKSQEIIVELARASKLLCDSGLTVADMSLMTNNADEEVKKAVVKFHQGVNDSHRELTNLINHFAEDLSDTELGVVAEKVGWKKTT